MVNPLFQWAIFNSKLLVITRPGISRYFYLVGARWRGWALTEQCSTQSSFRPWQPWLWFLGCHWFFASRMDWGWFFLVSPDDQTFKIELVGLIQICRFRCLEVCGNMSFSHLVKARSDRIPRLCSALKISIPRHAQITLTIESSNSAIFDASDPSGVVSQFGISIFASVPQFWWPWGLAVNPPMWR